MTERARPAGLPWMRLDARAGWQLSGLSSGLAGGDIIALGTPGQRPMADTEAFGTFGGRRLPRGLAIGADGRLFLADPTNRVILTALANAAAGPRPADAPSQWPFLPLWPARSLPPPPAAHELGPAPFPPADPYVLVRPVALAVAPNGDLAIADAGAGRVLVVALPSGRLRHVIPLTEPVAISFDAEGRAHVADVGEKTVVRFDRGWRRDPGYPHPSVPPIEGIAHLAHLCRAACCAGYAGRCGCEGGGAAAPDLFLVARGRLHALTRDGFLWSAGGIVRPGAGPLPVAALPDDARLAPPALTLSPEGALSWADPAWPGRAPLPLPGLAIDRNGRLPGTELPLIARPRRIELPLSGRAQFRALDGGREGFAWDRIVLIAQVPERTRLLVSTLATDAVLEEAQLDQLAPSAWSAPLEIGPADPPEAAVQSAGGRYLWIRLEMFGDGSRTSEITAVEVFAPRVSSLASLPAPYHQDPESARFLDRFLDFFDTVFAEIAAANGRTPALFDPQAVPAGPFLDWLASWFDITFLPGWPEGTRRTMVAQAVAMYRRRGTVPGLRQMLQWHTGLGEPMPAVIEHFRLTGPLSVGGVPLAVAPPAHAFTIVLPASAVPDDAALGQLGRVIAAAIPAHARAELRLIEPGIAIGQQSTLGVDMLIGGPGSSLGPAPLGAGRLGADLVFPPDRPTSVHLSDQGEPCPC
jgi:phage tail-like protein